MSDDFVGSILTTQKNTSLKALKRDLERSNEKTLSFLNRTSGHEARRLQARQTSSGAFEV